MSSLENELELEQKSEETIKRLIKKKQREIRFRLALFAVVTLFLVLFSPVGLQVVGNFCKPYVQNKVFGLIFQKTTDLLWGYGYYLETLFNYRYLYENTDEILNLELVQESLYDLAITYDQIQEYKAAEILYRIFKARWPNADESLIKHIDKRLEIRTLGDGGWRIAPPEWVLDLADKYGVSY